MAQYIDKDAVIAEIEKLKSGLSPNFYEYDYDAAKVELLEKLENFIDTLEVKENNLLTEKKIEKELAEIYISIFDKKFGNKLPRLKGKQLAEFKNFINTCEQTFHIKYFDYHATQGKLFEKLALLWAVWGKEHLNLEVKEVDLEKEIRCWMDKLDDEYCTLVEDYSIQDIKNTACHFFELGLKIHKGE